MNIEMPLKEVIGRLETLPEKLEKEFLLVGEKLRTIALLSKEIIRSSGQLFSFMDDGSLERSMDELKKMLNKSGIDAAGNHAAGIDIHQHMSDLEVSLHEAGRQIAELQKRNSSLRNLALMTRITSHSSGIKTEDFDTVAESINNLGSLINEKTTTILSGVTRLCSRVRDASSRILVFREKKQRIGESEIRDIRQSLEALGKAHEQCGTFSSLIATQSTEMSSSISGVVMSIQYHDITRQKMEHARDALESIHARCRHSSGSAAPADCDKELGDMCELQVAQLLLVHRELTKAIQTMESSLKTISATSDRTEANADLLSDVASEINRSYLSGANNDLLLAISSYAADVEAEEELALLTESVVETTMEISGFLEGIEEFGGEIKLIALNAMVKALRLNQEGAGMHVIAQAVKVESDLICDQTAAISGHFQQSNARAEQLRSRVSQVHGDRVLVQEQLSIQLQENLQEIQRRNMVITESVAVVHASSEKLRELVKDALRFVTANTLPETLAKEVIPALERVARELRRQQTLSTGRREEGGMLDKLRAAYTMKLEREIHDKYLGTGEVSRGKILPFQKRETLVPQTFDEEHLGQNVELF